MRHHRIVAVSLTLLWLIAALPLVAIETQTRSFDLGTIPDVHLVNQEGEPVRLASELIAGHVVALNFIFTRCATICSPMGAIFGKLQEVLPEGGRLISISVDPTYDTPRRLKEWSARFGADKRWTLLTGDKKEIDHLLKQIGVFTPVIEEHAPVVLLGNPATQSWRRAYGLAAPEQLAREMAQLGSAVTQTIRLPTAGRAMASEGDIQLASSPPPRRGTAQNERPALQDYLTDVRLVDQYGESMRLYSDLVRGKTVVINSFFGSCKESCPIINHKMAQLQQALGDRIGREIHLLSITVDPEHDTPERMRSLSQGFAARPGWYFLTGSKENVNFALARLGYLVDAKENHKNVFTVGNERTGLWKKALGVGSIEALIEIVRGVADDPGENRSGQRTTGTAGSDR